MSKSRNEMQKARRAYLYKCEKEGKKPMGAEAFARAWERKAARKTAKPTEQKPIKVKPPVKKSEKPEPKKRECVEEFTKGYLCALKTFGKIIEAMCLEVSGNGKAGGTSVKIDFFKRTK